MSNLLILYPDLQGNATLTTSLTEATGYGKENLSYGPLRRRFRGSSTTDSSYFNYDMGSGNTKSLDSIALIDAKRLVGDYVNYYAMRGSAYPYNLPTTISGLKAWFDPNRKITQASNAISAWNDCSGSGYTSAQSTAVNKPTLSTGASGINGNRSLSFDGSNDYLTTTYDPLLSSGLSIFCYVKPTTKHTGIICSAYLSGASARFELYHDNNGRLVWVTYAGTGTYRGRITGNNAYTAGQAMVISATYDGGTVPGGFKIYLNGVQVDSSDLTFGAYTTPVTRAKVMEIGSESSGAFVGYNGSIGDIICYEANIGTSDRQALEGYLTSKWITAPTFSGALSSSALQGVRSRDFYQAATASTAYRYWWLQLHASQASTYEHSKQLACTAFDFGRDPMWGRELEEDYDNGNFRFAPRGFTLNWQDISDAKISSFESNIADYRDVATFGLAATSYTPALMGKDFMACRITDYKVSPVSTNRNDISVTFEELF